jgi:hypothetical protein
MQQVTIGNLSFSRIVCGTNPFYGHSHFSAARDAEYRVRFDDRMIQRTIERCISLGINTVESCANERIIAILAGLQTESTGPIHFVGSTRIDETSPIKSHQQKLSFLRVFPRIGSRPSSCARNWIMQSIRICSR